MANFVYNTFKKGVVGGSYNLAALQGTLKLLIASNSYSPDIDAHIYRATISGTLEVSGSGYTAGGVNVSSPNLQIDTTLNQAILYGTNLSITPITFTSGLYGVLYFSTPNGAASDPLFCALDLGTDPASGNFWAVTAGTFNINFPAAGILAFT